MIGAPTPVNFIVEILVVTDVLSFVLHENILHFRFDCVVTCICIVRWCTVRRTRTIDSFAEGWWSVDCTHTHTNVRTRKHKINRHTIESHRAHRFWIEQRWIQRMVYFVFRKMVFGNEWVVCTILFGRPYWLMVRCACTVLCRGRHIAFLCFYFYFIIW